MKRNKETDLTLATYLYIVRCWSEQDFESLAAMGLESSEMETLRALPLSDLDRLSEFRLQPLTIQLDRERLTQLLSHLERERQQDHTFQTLILMDAPFPMMRTLFGIDEHSYANWRRLLEIPLHSGGRPLEPDEDTAHRVWREWKALLGDRAPEGVHPHEFITLQAQTQCPLRSIWTVIQTCYQDNGKTARPSSEIHSSPL